MQKDRLNNNIGEIMRRICFLLMILALVACKKEDNGTSPSEKESFVFPLAVGSEWTYGIFEKDENYDDFDTPFYEYKSTIIRKLDYKGKESYELDKENRLVYKYFSVDEDGIYGHPDYENLSSDGKNYYPNDWITLYDFANDEWTMYSKYLEVEDGDFKAEGTIAMFGRKIGKSSQIINGNETDIYEFMAIQSVEATETYNGVSQTTSERDTSYIKLADGIGIYSISQFESEIDEEYPDYGWTEKVIDFKINQ